VSSEALLLIDLQRGMFGSAKLASVWQGEALREKVRSLLVRARAAGAPVILVQHAGPVGHPLEEGTEGWELHSDVAPMAGEVVVVKRTPDAFLDTDLHDILRQRRIHSLAVAGIQTEFCIDTTCRRAFSLGYEVTLCEDAHSTWDTDTLQARQIIEHHNRLLSDWFVTTCPASAVEFLGRDEGTAQDAT